MYWLKTHFIVFTSQSYGTLFLLYGRNDFEKMTQRRYEYIKGLNGHSEIALYVGTFEEVDAAYNNAIKNGATSVLEPELEPWGHRTMQDYVKAFIKTGFIIVDLNEPQANEEQAKISVAMAWINKIPLYLYWELKK